MRRRVAILAACLLVIASFAAITGAILASDASRWTNDADVDSPAREAEPRRVLWSTPAPIEPLNSDAHDYEPRVSADGRWLVFVRGLAGGQADLWIAERSGRGWSEPIPIADLNTDADELGPELSADARSLYFYSDREGSLGGYDLWVSRRAERTNSWRPPENLGPRVNSAWNEYAPALDPAGETLWFASNRPRPDEPAGPFADAWPATIREDRARRDYDLYASALTDAGPDTARRDEALSTAADEGSPAWSPAGDWLYFASDRPGGLGGHDLYRARSRDHASIEPLQPGINTPYNESDPAISDAGFTIAFSSDRPGDDAGDRRDYQIYSSTSREVHRVRDSEAAAAAWRRAMAIALGILLAALLALLAFLIIRNKKLQARFAKLSLLAQCLVVSAIAHALIVLLMTVVYVGGAMGVLPGRSGPTRVAIVSGSGSIVTQLRGPGVEANLAVETPALFAAHPAPAEPRIESLALAAAEAAPTLTPARPEAAAAGDHAPIPSPAIADAGLPTPAAMLDAPRLSEPESSARVGVSGIDPSSPAFTPTVIAAMPDAAPASLAVGPAPASSSFVPEPMRASDVALAADAPTTMLPESRRRASEPTATAAIASSAPYAMPSGPTIVEARLEPVFHVEPASNTRAPNAPIGAATGRESAPGVRLDDAAFTVGALPEAARGDDDSEHHETASASLAPAPIDAPADAGLMIVGAIGEAEHPGVGEPARVMASPLAESDVRPTLMPDLATTDWGSPALPEAPHEAPANPFPQRDETVRGELAEAMGGSEKTEAAVERSLDWLKRHQSADGRWSSREFDDGCGHCAGRAGYDFDSATTGLALMCMLGAGQTHSGDGPYAESVGRGLEWLLARESEGDLRGGETMYSQGIATIALVEAHAMTRDGRLRGPLERAVGFILDARHDPTGAWRYEPGQFGDTSVLGWQVMALKSARNAGIDVPDAAFEAAGTWLGTVAFGQDGLYAYQPGMEATRSMTAEGMFVRQLLGARRDEPRMARSATFVLEELPGVGVGTTYQWYYGTLALYQHQGDEWDRWNEALVTTLLETQETEGESAGSWDPSDRWSRIGGRVYQTAICTLSLEVYYRYLPGFVVK